MSEVDQVYGEI